MNTTNPQDEKDRRDLIQQGNDPEIMRLLSRLVDLGQIPGRERFETLVALGTRYAVLASGHQAGKKFQARADFEGWVKACLELNVGVSDSPFQAPRTDQRAMDWYWEAVSFLSSALDIWGTFAGYLLRGLVYAALEQYSDAQADLDLALALAPHAERPTVYYLRGLTLLALGNISEGLSDMESASHLDESSTEYRSILARAKTRYAQG